MMKVKQKISGTFRSEKGARDFCRLRGSVAMIEKHGRQVSPELMRVFKGAPFMPTAVHRVP